MSDQTPPGLPESDDDSWRDRSRRADQRHAHSRRERRRERRRAQRTTATEPVRRGIALTSVLAVVLLVAGVAAGVAIAPEGSVAPDVPVQPVIEPVGSAELVCPEPGTFLGAIVVPGQPGQDRAGTGSLVPFPGSDQPTLPITAIGAEVRVSGTALPPIVVGAQGGFAPGLVADQRNGIQEGPTRGLSSMACTPAGSSFWFVGASSLLGRAARIHLVNPESASAEVDIEAFGPDGPLPAVAGRGLVIPARSVDIVKLPLLAPAQRVVAIHVISRSGRIAASVDEIDNEGQIALGSDWLPVAAPPSTVVTIPGIQGNTGSRLLSMLAPGDRDATVRLRLLTEEGSFVPAGFEEIDLPAGQVVSLDLSLVLAGRRSAALLTSDQPIVAGIRQVRLGSESSDFSFSAGTPPLTGPSALVAVPTSTAIRTVITVSSVEGAALDVAAVPVLEDGTAGTPIPQGSITVEQGGVTIRDSQVTPLTGLPEGTARATLILTPQPGSGAYSVGHTFLTGTPTAPLVTGYPWGPLRVTVSLPQAREDLSVGVPVG